MFSLLHHWLPFDRGSARRSAIRALRRMPAHQRQDLGIAEDQIEAVVDAMLVREAQREEQHSSSIGPPRLPVTAARAFAYPGVNAPARA